tara:strand:- start:145 stop:1128 length:984 start_codon:yes stop_codon:yes gene_type:complete
VIISRTPYRISFFGGGTDYPDWYLKNGGQVLSTTIDKYVHITCRYLPPFFDHKIQLVYSKIERVKNIDELTHPSAREVIKYLNISDGLEIHYDGDLPSRSGIGSSSAFTVGLLSALYAYKEKMISKHQLAMESIDIEQNIIKEVVGSQDQISAAYGGLNHIKFLTSGEVKVSPLIISNKIIRKLKNNLMLFYTGYSRTAEKVAKSYVENIKDKEKQLKSLNNMVEQSIKMLREDRLEEFGLLMNESWYEKRSLSNLVSNKEIDELYDKAISLGALGGKLTGAGGGGFLMLFVPEDKQDKLRNELSNLIFIPFDFENNGNQIIYYDKN